MRDLVPSLVILAYIALPVVAVIFVVICVRLWKAGGPIFPKKRKASERLAEKEARKITKAIEEGARQREEAWQKSPDNPSFQLKQKYEAYFEANRRYYEAAEAHAPNIDELKAQRDSTYRDWKTLQQKPVFIPGPYEDDES